MSRQLGRNSSRIEFFRVPTAVTSLPCTEDRREIATPGRQSGQEVDRQSRSVFKTGVFILNGNVRRVRASSGRSRDDNDYFPGSQRPEVNYGNYLPTENIKFTFFLPTFLISFLKIILKIRPKTILTRFDGRFWRRF